MLILRHPKQIVLVNVTYYRPDFPTLLQQFMWETDDYVPDLPRVHRFLLYWKEHIHAIIRAVDVCTKNHEFRRVIE
jgi:uncharacterized protein Usg